MFSHGFSKMMNAQSNALLVFSSTLFVYLGHRFYKLKTNQIIKESNRILWMKSHDGFVKVVLILSAISTLYLGIEYSLQHTHILGWAAVAILITAFYVVKIKNKNLREIPYMKNIWVVLVYWFVVVGLTGFSLPPEFQPPFYLYINQLIYIFAIALLFDIPDITIDPKDQKTIPQVIGANASMSLSVLATVIFLVYLGYSHGLEWHYFIFVFVLASFYYHLKKTSNLESYLSFYGEGVLGILGVYYFLIH